MSVSGQTFRGIIPASGTAVTYAQVTATSANTWYQLVASTSSAIYVLGIKYGFNGTGTYKSHTVNLGTGAAASEATVATVFGESSSGVCGDTEDHRTFTVPIRVPASTRIAIRDSLASGNQIGIFYVAESKVV